MTLTPGAVHIGDARTLAGQLAPQSIHTIITSPPYFGLRSYLAADHPQKAQELGSEATVGEYVANLVGLFRLLRPALRDDSVAWVNLGDSYGEGKQLQGVPWRFAFAMQDDGWILRSDCVWAKPNPMPESVRDRPTRSHEYLFLLSKSARYFYDAEAIAEPYAPDSIARDKRARLTTYAPPGQSPRAEGERCGNGGRNKRDVWTIATQPYPDAHFATFPPELVRPCIRAGTSERGVCAACGAPWRRVVVREASTEARKNHAGNWASKGGASRIGGFYDAKAETIGWSPTCTCDAGVRPAVVLDPFAGSGTVAQVCVEEGRNWLGFDLDERSIGWHEGRLRALPVRSLFAVAD